MELNGLLTIGLITSIGGSVLYFFKDMFINIFNKVYGKFIYTAKIYQYDELFYIIEDWIIRHYPGSQKQVEAYVSERDVKIGGDEKDNKRVYYRQEEDLISIVYKGKKIWINKNKEKFDKAQNQKDLFFSKYTITGWRINKEISDLLEEMLEEYKSLRKESSINIYTSNSWGDWVLSKTTCVKPLDSIILHSDTKKLIKNDLQEFSNSREFYSKTGIPYKRGYCFYGFPGNGKTSLSLAIGASTGKDIYILNMNSLMDDGCLQKAFTYIGNNSVLLIEDIDKVFSKRDSLKEKVSFSCFLNCLDGGFYKDGTISIITTNHIENLDDALLRDGRTDVKIEISKPEKEQVYEYLELFYDMPISRNGLQTNLSMSSIQEKCLKNKKNHLKALEEIHNIC